MRAPRSILITGGSSGIGRALALAYAAPEVNLALTGRNAERIRSTAETCQSKGAKLRSAQVDVVDAAGLEAWIAEVDQAAPLDLVIANAGISAGLGRSGAENASQTRALFATNIDGVVNTVMPAIDLMRRRGRGQIAIMASLAGYRGMPGAPAYAASKAAVKAWGEGLRVPLAREGIALSVICPGFVKSRMTAVNDFPMPFLMEGERAAEIIRRGLARNQARISFPWPMAAGVWLLAALPPAWADRLLSRAPNKE